MTKKDQVIVETSYEVDRGEDGQQFPTIDPNKPLRAGQVIVDPIVKAGGEMTLREDRPVQIFNPLDAEPVSFQKQLLNRSENYDALALHLRSILVPGKDFGQIHVKKSCDKYRCTDPAHLSDYGLWAPGADKVLGILGLAPAYPGEEDYIYASTHGLLINDVIIKCYIVGTSERRITEGMGACSRDEPNMGTLNNVLKRACKRARLDAVLRLPSISALFEDDFLRDVAKGAKKQNSTTSRQQQVSPKHDTGAMLQVFPLKGELAEQRFDQMDDNALDWCIRTFETSKPDIHRSALRVREARSNPPADSEPAQETNTPRPSKQDIGTSRDFLAEYDREQAFENSRHEEQQ